MVRVFYNAKKSPPFREWSGGRKDRRSIHGIDII
jgi:hypothetical protein